MLDLFKRHELFEKTIHEVYPDMRLLGTAGPILGCTADRPCMGLLPEWPEDESGFLLCSG